MQITLSGTLTHARNKTHTSHTFEMPPGARELSLRFSVAADPAAPLRPLLCLSLFSPDGFRGAGHRGRLPQLVRLSDAETTPGYRHGPLTPGLWTVVIDAHRIMPGTTCSYHIDGAVQLGGPEAPAHPRASAPTHERAGPPATGPAWYRGDLHSHTNHSDGSWSLQEAWAWAAASGLQFIASTDHNTISQIDELERQTGTPLLVIRGMELTTFKGHALSLGTREWIDWRVRPGARDMSMIAEEVERAGGLFVIAHPLAAGDPECTGCDWRYEDMMPGTARAVEVWNSPWGSNSHNEANVRLWYDWLNAGKRLVATAGTDAHRNPGPGDHRLGFNVVCAEECSEAAILRAVSRGRLYLSCGPELGVEAAAGSATAGMGETLAARDAELRVSWDGCPEGSTLRLVADGERRAENATEGRGRRAFSCAGSRWHVVEIRHADGGLLALSNPVFLESGG